MMTLVYTHLAFGKLRVMDNDKFRYLCDSILHAKILRQFETITGNGSLDGFSYDENQVNTFINKITMSSSHASQLLSKL